MISLLFCQRIWNCQSSNKVITCGCIIQKTIIKVSLQCLHYKCGYVRENEHIVWSAEKLSFFRRTLHSTQLYQWETKQRTTSHSRTMSQSTCILILITITYEHIKLCYWYRHVINLLVHMSINLSLKLVQRALCR